MIVAVFGNGLAPTLAKPFLSCIHALLLSLAASNTTFLFFFINRILPGWCYGDYNSQHRGYAEFDLRSSYACISHSGASAGEKEIIMGFPANKKRT
jgi:hypothetical protein